MTKTAKSSGPPRKSKSDTVLQMLRRRQGATIDELVNATFWKPHSCRAFLTGVRKSHAQLLQEERADGKTSYRIAVIEQAAA